MERLSQPGRLRVWLLATRPKTLGAAVAPVLIGSAIAHADGVFHAQSAGLALLGAMLIQVGTNFANDYYDFVKGADTADRVGPTRVTQAGLVSPAQVRRAFIAVFVLAAGVGALLMLRGGWPIAVIGALSIASGILYTGGPRPLGYLGLGDLFVLVFFGPVAVAGTYYVQALDVTPAALAAGVAAGLFSTSLLAVNNLRDVETDEVAGKRTLAVRLGRGFVRAEYVLCLVGAVGIPLALAVLGLAPSAVGLCLLVVPLALLPIRQMFRSRGAALNQTLGRTGKLLLVYSVLLSVGWALG